MKKRYSIPETKVVKIQTSKSLLTLSDVKLDPSKSVDAASVDSRQDNSWDIWGTGDYDEE